MELTTEILAAVMTTLCGAISFVFWLYRQAQQARIEDLKSSIERRDGQIAKLQDTIDAYQIEVGALKRKLNGENDA